MYKIASDRRQSALHRGRLTDWVGGEEKLSLADQLAQLQDGARILEARCLKAEGDERKKLGLEKFAIQTEISVLRKKHGMERKLKDGLSQFIVDAAKAMLPRVQFDMIYRAAERDYNSMKKDFETLEGGDQ